VVEGACQLACRYFQQTQFLYLTSDIFERDSALQIEITTPQAYQKAKEDG
jgi:hypothetical protein